MCVFQTVVKEELVKHNVNTPLSHIVDTMAITLKTSVFQLILSNNSFSVVP